METTTHSELCTAVSFELSLIVTGPDPADPTRILIKKIVQVSEGTYGYEEVTITKREGDKPSVHSKLVRLGDWDLTEDVST